MMRACVRFAVSEAKSTSLMRLMAATWDSIETPRLLIAEPRRFWIEPSVARSLDTFVKASSMILSFSEISLRDGPSSPSSTPPISAPLPSRASRS